MKKNIKKQLEFEGLLLNEAIDDRIVKAGQNLILEVAPTGAANAMIVQAGVYEKRPDGVFSLEVVFPGTVRTAQTEIKHSIIDLVVAIFEHEDAPYWLLDVISEGINDNAAIDAFDPDIIRAQMAFTSSRKTNRKRGGK